MPSATAAVWCPHRDSTNGGANPAAARCRSGSGRVRAPRWHLPDCGSHADGSEIDSACIVTTDANDDVGPIHDRMPVIISPENFAPWLAGPTDEALQLMQPAGNGQLETVRVSTRVNSARNDDPSLQESEPDLFG